MDGGEQRWMVECRGGRWGMEWMVRGKGGWLSEVWMVEYSGDGGMRGEWQKWMVCCGDG